MGKAAVNRTTSKQQTMTTMKFAKTYGELPDEYNNGVPYSNADGDSKELTCTQKILIGVGILTLASFVWYRFIR